MEIIAYAGGFQLYHLIRRRSGQARIPFEQNIWVLVGAIFGALFGSKLLAWLESPGVFFPHLTEPAAWAGGKTIVGGLLGGWIGVEIAKKCVRLQRSTGDAMVFPLIFGMCVGRIGCFLTGLDDDTYGNYTNLPWGVDFGDGPRHPTQLYDIVFLVSLGVILWLWARKARPNGKTFAIFLVCYMLYRFAIEILKPLAPRHYSYAGLSAIQWASLAGAVAAYWILWRREESIAIAS